MPYVKPKDGESFDSLMRRFKRVVEKCGLFKEIKKREFHQKGAVLRQRRIAAAKKRLLKRLYREKLSFQPSSATTKTRGNKTTTSEQRTKRS